MKKAGILHGELSKIIAEAGHGETIVIADYGLRIPEGVNWIDLAVTEGVPSFLSVLESVVSELTVEAITLTHELKEGNPGLFERIQELTGKEPTLLHHEAFKQLTKSAKVVIRTGEWTPYANIALHAGVVF